VISILYITFSVSYDTGKIHETGNPSNFGLILEHIKVLAEIQIISMYCNRRMLAFLTRFEILTLHFLIAKCRLLVLAKIEISGW
jgi:hypothetical protein